MITPDVDPATCDVSDLVAFVVTCGRSSLTEDATVFIYPYDSVTKAEAKYCRLWWSWCSRAWYTASTIPPFWPNSCAWDILVDEWDPRAASLAAHKKLMQVKYIADVWFHRMLRRELQKRQDKRRKEKRILPPEDAPAGERTPAQECEEDLELVSVEARKPI